MNQTYPNIRHLVSADTPETLEYLKEYDDVDVVPVSFEEHKALPAIPDPGTGFRCVFNLYFNTLHQHVGDDEWVLYLDDDDCLSNKNVIKNAMDKINSPDDMVIWRMMFKHGWVVPPKANMEKPPMLARIGTPCVVFHSSNITKWDGWKCGDFRAIETIYNKAKNHIWIHDICVILGNNGGHGKREDM